MFASDFPVAGLWATFDEVCGAFKTIVAGFSSDERSALFFDTVKRAYRLWSSRLRRRAARRPVRR